MLIKLDTIIIFHLLYFFLTKILCCIFRLKYCIYLFWKNVLYLLVDIFIIFICLPGANGTIEMIDFRKSRDLIWNLRNTSHATTTIFIPFLNQIKIKIEDSKSHNSLIESKKQKQWKQQHPWKQYLLILFKTVFAISFTPTPSSSLTVSALNSPPRF